MPKRCGTSDSAKNGSRRLVREPFPTTFDEALKAAGAELEAERQGGVPVAETWLEWMQKRFREAYPLGRDGEQMLAETLIRNAPRPPR